MLAALAALTWVVSRTGRPRPANRVLISLLCLTLVGLHALWSLAMTTYTVLDPAGPDGCRVVVRESTFLLSGDGSAGVVGRHGGPVRLTGSYKVNDGGTPVRDGSYELTWGSQGSASLSVPQSYDPDPVEPDLACR